jgi:hypothetical protein
MIKDDYHWLQTPKTADELWERRRTGPNVFANPSCLVFAVACLFACGMRQEDGRESHFCKLPPKREMTVSFLLQRRLGLRLMS